MGLLFSLAGVPHLIADMQATGSGPVPEPQVGPAQLGLLLPPARWVGCRAGGGLGTTGPGAVMLCIWAEAKTLFEYFPF